MTGLGNRKYFDRSIEAAVLKAQPLPYAGFEAVFAGLMAGRYALTAFGAEDMEAELFGDARATNGGLLAPVEVAPARLFDLVGKRWVDVCRLPEAETRT